MRPSQLQGLVVATLVLLNGCAETEQFCGRESCEGCCAGGVCHTSDETHCGLQGSECKACQNGATCLLGRCSSTTPKTCAESCGAGCCQGGECRTGLQDDACGLGALSCVDCKAIGHVCDAATRQCIPPGGGCGPSTCAGCCFGLHCEGGTEKHRCGVAGASCQSCGADQACHQGICVPAGSVDFGISDATGDGLHADARFNIVVWRVSIKTPKPSCGGSTCTPYVEVVISKGPQDQLIGKTSSKVGNQVVFAQTVLRNIPRSYFDRFTNSFSLIHDDDGSFQVICTDFLTIDDSVLNRGTWAHQCADGSATVELRFERLP